MSATIATVLALVTSMTVLLGLCVALLGTVLAAVCILFLRVEDRVEAEDHRSALLLALDDTPWLLKELRDIATSAKKVLGGNRNVELLSDLIRTQIGDTKAFMQELELGHIRVPADDVTPMSNQIDLVNESVLATTIPEIDNEWWLTPEGRNYLAGNRRAVERGVSIQRIVLWDKRPPRFGQMLDEQRAAGVQVLFAKRSDVPDSLKTSIAIYDRLNYHDIVFNADGDGVYFEYYLNPREVQQAVARFEQLRERSTAEIPAEITSWLTPSDAKPPA